MKKIICFYTLILTSFIFFAFSSCRKEKETTNSTSNPCVTTQHNIGPMIDSRTIVPEDGAVDLPAIVTVSWKVGGSRNPATTRVYLGKSPDDMKIIYSEPTQFNYVNLGQLEFNTTYYWKVTIIENMCGRGASSGTLSFTTRKQ